MRSSRNTTREILLAVSKGEISVAKAEKLLRLDAIDKVSGIAQLDTGREMRRGIPEVVLAEGKTLQQLSAIVSRMGRRQGRTIVSRISEDTASFLIKRSRLDVSYNKTARTLVLRKRGLRMRRRNCTVGIMTGGTSDIPIAEEAVVIVEEMGYRVIKAYDVGVASLARLLRALRDMISKDVDVLVVVAGMEGALPSVVSGLVDIPVIGVPSSSGYGYGRNGETALMAMLQSCSSGLCTVNIDNGIGAGAAAALIASRISQRSTKSES